MGIFHNFPSLLVQSIKKCKHNTHTVGLFSQVSAYNILRVKTNCVPQLKKNKIRQRVFKQLATNAGLDNKE